MLPQAGVEPRPWREVVALGRELSALPALPAGDRSASVALVFDWENWWAIENSDHPVVLDYVSLVRNWYDALHRQHVQVDFVRATSDLAGYRLVIAPQLYLLTSAGASSLNSFVEGGGHLLVTAFSDVVDENDAFRPGGYLTQLRSTLGVRVEEFGALALPGSPAGAGQSAALLSSPSGPVTGTLLAEEIDLTGATALGNFEGGRLDGRPAFTVAEAGAGRAYYLATIPDTAGVNTVVSYLVAGAEVKPG